MLHHRTHVWIHVDSSLYLIKHTCEDCVLCLYCSLFLLLPFCVSLCLCVWQGAWLASLAAAGRGTPALNPPNHPLHKSLGRLITSTPDYSFTVYLHVPLHSAPHPRRYQALQASQHPCRSSLNLPLLQINSVKLPTTTLNPNNTFCKDSQFPCSLLKKQTNISIHSTETQPYNHCLITITFFQTFDYDTKKQQSTPCVIVTTHGSFIPEP